MIPIKGKYSTAYIMVDDPEHVVDSDEYKQILSFVNCPVFTNDSRIMPDYHYGKGCVIGFTMPLTDQIIPNIVGVDIGCNMRYVSFQKYLDFDKDQWLAVARQIRRHIPMAQKHRKEVWYKNFETGFPWSLANMQQLVFTSSLNKHFGTNYKGPDYTPKWFFDLCKRVNCKPVVGVNSIGSLGGGNHFIEFSISERTKHTGVTVHSGSRNLGLKIANYWQRKAVANLKERHRTKHEAAIKHIKENLPTSQWDAAIRAAKEPAIVNGLEYLDGEDWFGYLHEMNFAQIYASENTAVMAMVILDVLNLDPQLAMSEYNVHTVHNCISFDDLIIRKGAVSSRVGQKMLIPFNMEDGILVCEGKSNEDWYFSAPHGAGRLHGRKAMKKNKAINTRDIRDRMNSKGIYVDVLPKDEVKEAYKDPAFIEKAISPTATIADRLKSVLTLKADD